MQDRRIIFKVGRRYYGFHDRETEQVWLQLSGPELGEFLRIGCWHWDDYQVGGYLRPLVRRVTSIRTPSEEERDVLELANSDIVVELAYLRPRKRDVAYRPIRTVFWWRSFGVKAKS